MHSNLYVLTWIRGTCRKICFRANVNVVHVPTYHAFSKSRTDNVDLCTQIGKDGKAIEGSQTAIPAVHIGAYLQQVHAHFLLIWASEILFW
jgi:hypothetical protein